MGRGEGNSLYILVIIIITGGDFISVIIWDYFVYMWDKMRYFCT